MAKRSIKKKKAKAKAKPKAKAKAKSKARAKVKATRQAAVRSLNVGLRRHPIRPMGFSVPLHAVESQTPGETCQVLDLVLGPLHLELLGLVVDLNRVHLTITATRGGGILGDLFCSLASKPL